MAKTCRPGSWSKQQECHTRLRGGGWNMEFPFFPGWKGGKLPVSREFAGRHHFDVHGITVNPGISSLTQHAAIRHSSSLSYQTCKSMCRSVCYRLAFSPRACTAGLWKTCDPCIE